MVGEMRHRLQFWKTVKGRNESTGEQKNTWVQHVELWGKYEFLKSGSGEDELGGRDGYERNVVFTIRYRDDLINEMYVKLSDQDEQYEILSILADLKRNYLTIEAQQVNPADIQNLSDSDGNEWNTGDNNGWQFTGDGPTGN